MSSFSRAGWRSLAGKTERAEADELRKEVQRLERTLGRKTMELEISGETVAGMGVTERVARSRELVAAGRPAATVARVAQISRQAIYRRPKRPPKGQRRPPSDDDRVILNVARHNPTDGTRMVAALAGRELGRPVNRKKARRLMGEHRLPGRHRPSGRRRRPGFFRVERPDQLWHMEMSAIWTAEHGWSYLNTIIDCPAREITGWALDVRCRAQEAQTVLQDAVADRQIAPGELVLGTDTPPPTPAAPSGPGAPSWGSRIAAAATATPSPRRSSRAGSAS